MLHTRIQYVRVHAINEHMMFGVRIYITNGNKSSLIPCYTRKDEGSFKTYVTYKMCRKYTTLEYEIISVRTTYENV